MFQYLIDDMKFVNLIISSLKTSKCHLGTCGLLLINVDQFEINECSPYQCNHYIVGVHSWHGFV